MRWCIDGCICKPGMTSGETRCGSDDSLLGRSRPPTGRAVNTIQNSWRTSPLLDVADHMAGAWKWARLHEPTKTLEIMKGLHRRTWQHGCADPHACGTATKNQAMP